MMAIDTSALLAVLENEPEAEQFERLLADSEQSLISAGTALEATLVIERRYGPQGAQNLNALLHEAAIEIVPFDEVQLEAARVAFRRFGRGTHQAALNFGDCFSYALAKTRGVPLLYKGHDFGLTDIESVL